MTNKMYDRAKWVAMVLLPALGSLYFGLSGYWGLPNSEAVVGTITVVDTFLGVLLGLQSKSYGDSDAVMMSSVDIQETEDGPMIQMQPLDFKDASSIHALKEIRLKVNKS